MNGKNAGSAANTKPGRWAKGQSGNPKGRKPVFPEVRELLNGHAKEAVVYLAAVMKDPEVDPKTRITAASTILTYALPKPKDPGELGDMAKALEAFANAITEE